MPKPNNQVSSDLEREEAWTLNSHSQRTSAGKFENGHASMQDSLDPASVQPSPFQLLRQRPQQVRLPTLPNVPDRPANSAPACITLHQALLASHHNKGIK